MTKKQVEEAEEYEKMSEEELANKGFSTNLSDFKDLIGDLDGFEELKRWHKDAADDVQTAIENNLDGIEQAENRLKKINKYLNDRGIFPYKLKGAIYYKAFVYSDKKTGKIYKRSNRKDLEDYRKNIKTQLTRIYELFSKKDKDPALAEHLKKFIKTGKECVYRPYPDHRINWYVKY